MKTNRKYRLSEALKNFLLGVFILMAASCNETMLDTLEYNYPSPVATSESNHALLIVLDGASGRAIQTARNAYKTPVLKSLFSHALYTDYGLADNSGKVLMGKMNNARGWVNLFAGSTSHGIKEETQLDQLGNQHIFSWLMESRTHISMFASDEKFHDTFVTEGMNAPELTTDLEVKEQVVEELENTLKQPVDLVVAEFKGVQSAGESNGCYEEDGTVTDAVVNAIGELDNYIGEIMEALKARPGYKKENWLVIVTSNYGGAVSTSVEENDYYDDLTRNTFTLMYNERLVAQVQGRPSSSSVQYEYYTPLWAYDYRYPNPTEYAESAGLRGNTTLGNIEWDELEDGKTIMFFIQSDAREENKGRTEAYAILSKSSDVTANGWMFCFVNTGGTKIRHCIGKSGSNRFYTMNSAIDGDVAWHSFAAVFGLDDSKSKLEMTYYLDGKLDGSKTLSQKDFNKYMTEDMKKIPLRVGGAYNRDAQDKHSTTKNKQYKSCFNISNIQIYNKGLSAEEIEKYAGMNQLHKKEEAYPLWNNLIGYWPCDLESDMMDPVLKDYSKYRQADGSTDFEIDRGSTKAWFWGKSEDPGMHPILESDKMYYSRTFNTVDVSRQIFLWLSKNICWNWSMEGKAWQFAYTDMQIGQN